MRSAVGSAGRFKNSLIRYASHGIFESKFESCPNFRNLSGITFASNKINTPSVIQRNLRDGNLKILSHKDNFKTKTLNEYYKTETKR